MRAILLICLFLVSVVEAKLPSTIVGIDAIYGKDDRELISSSSASSLKKLAKSVAMIVTVDHLEIGFLRTTIRAKALKDNLNMCVSENFVSKPSLTSCTGFLVAPDLVATAGHCFQTDEDCGSKKIIFEVDAQNQNRKGYAILSKNVYSCKEIVTSVLSEDRDYALIRLDRVTKRTPLKLSRAERIDNSASVFMIGHPFGLPLMYSKNSTISDNNNSFIFKTFLDSFEGNSGSPVFNSKTLEVEGILVNGQEDLVLDSDLECYRNRTYEGAGGEGVLRIQELLPFVK